MGKLDGKVALVTGGNSGIGRGIVHRFIAEGGRVAFAGRDRGKGETVLNEIGEMHGDGAFYALDLADEEAVADLIARIERRFGRLDIVVNNAGVGGRRSGILAEDRPGTRWQKMRGPNLDSTYFVSAYAMPHLARTKGSIVNISSTATLHGNWGLYCVAKAAIEGLTRALAAEGGPHGVRANCISPGWINTEIDATSPPSGSTSGEWQLPPSLLGRTGTPAEIASVALFLASEEASFVTGQTLIVDGGLAITDYTSLPMLAVHGKKLQSGMI
ncbi:MAG: SDR family NAD(P)-dependent oxidoreductase [Hyphomicrobiaceae bacterium]